MSKTFKVNVNSSLEFDISETESSQLNSISTSQNNYHILYDNIAFHAQVSPSVSNDKSIEVIVNNNTYNVNIFNELDILIKDMGFELGSSKVVNNVKAPMPGLILDIHVEIGQEVKENDSLLILEAMKMENVLTSPRDGIIAAICVEKGDAVDKNKLLIEFET